MLSFEVEVVYHQVVGVFLNHLEAEVDALVVELKAAEEVVHHSPLVVVVVDLHLLVLA